jgi:5-oxoprolinase (ATP-hydrolysing) subunit A
MTIPLNQGLLLNADVGESWEFARSGEQTSLLRCLDLANVCCGGHAGDAALMRQTLEEATALGIRVGAHPGYEDRENFGRLERFAELGPARVADLVERQVALAAHSAVLFHVKPHGALYNEAARSEAVAEAIAEGVRRVDPRLLLVGLAGTRMLDVWQLAGFAVLRESFADRGYTPEGFLIPRGQAGAHIEDPQQVLANLPHLAAISDTICIHGDGPRAVDLARFLRAALNSSSTAANR